MVKNGFFWNNSKNIDISILRKEQNLYRSEFYMRLQSLVKIDWEMPVKNPRWLPRNLVFYVISTSDRGDFPRIIVIALFFFLFFFLVVKIQFCLNKLLNILFWSYVWVNNCKIIWLNTVLQFLPEKKNFGRIPSDKSHAFNTEARGGPSKNDVIC